METHFVTEKERDQRLDKYLAHKFPDYSRSYFQSLIEEKLVLINGEVVKKRTRVQEGDEIEVEFVFTPEISLKAEPIPLDILYEDSHLIAVNKSVGMVVHPAVGNWSGTFVNALLHHCQLEGEGVRPGIVHRLDKETSGVLLAAKEIRTQQALVSLFAERKIDKRYLAITIGNPGNRLIEGRIGRHPVRRKMMAVLESGGKEASTRIETERCDGQLSVVSLFPQTGRTHQLRVHLKSIGTPILGDSLYGNSALNRKWGANRQMLHAASLSFRHPITQQDLTIEAPPPEDLAAFLQRVR